MLSFNFKNQKQS